MVSNGGGGALEKSQQVKAFLHGGQRGAICYSLGITSSLVLSCVGAPIAKDSRGASVDEELGRWNCSFTTDFNSSGYFVDTQGFWYSRKKCDQQYLYIIAPFLQLSVSPLLPSQVVQTVAFFHN